ncbi:ABC transporter permease subunit [Phenylobacterium sp. SCN 70-31]|uniref:ABC transporter permease subunit n=1 Tax=Phenylobacterium sp. SCN 70-31 TaxID=1660129 RepID=UPI0025EF35CD|nr:ABC transporter permease subunit [Phenylobacterium sp. SCN 70-31]
MTLRSGLRAPSPIAAAVPAGIACAVAALVLLAPLATLALRSLSGPDGALTLANYGRYLATPTLRESVMNTGLLGGATTLIVLPLAFLFAFGIERTNMRFKGVMSALCLFPVLTPSLLPAMGLVYLFGHQGLLTPLLGGNVIYGAHGVLISEIVAAFPHAVIMLRAALSMADARLYEQAEILGAGPWRRFRAVTLPSVRYGLVGAGIVVFTRAITDIGAPAVLGGDFGVLALDIYKQVLGQQNFEMGSVVAMLLLAPSLVLVGVERLASSRQAAMVSGKSTARHPPRHVLRDVAFTTYGAAVTLALASLLLTCQMAALARMWPYDLSFSFASYDLERYDGGWRALRNSIGLATAVAVSGALAAFTGAYVAQRTRPAPALRGLFVLLALLPAATPGLALGLAYALFFGDPANPFHLIYGTFAILLVATVIHFYSVAHLTSVSALNALDVEFEPAAAVLGRGALHTVVRVIAPLSAVPLLEIALYLFVNAMTTVSAAVFLYPTDFKLASVSILNMDDAGDMAPAAAMGMMILYVNLGVRLLAQGAGSRLRHAGNVLAAPTARALAGPASDPVQASGAAT